MHSPRHSEAASMMHPSTPCSASSECGGNRSILDGSTGPECFRGRVFFKSTVGPPVLGSTVSIMFQLAFSIQSFENQRRASFQGSRRKARSSHSPRGLEAMATYINLRAPFSPTAHNSIHTVGHPRSYGSDPIKRQKGLIPWQPVPLKSGMARASDPSLSKRAARFLRERSQRETQRLLGRRSLFKKKRKRKRLLRANPWERWEEELVGTKPDKMLARELGRSLGSVSTRRRL